MQPMKYIILVLNRRPQLQCQISRVVTCVVVGLQIKIDKLSSTEEPVRSC